MVEQQLCVLHKHMFTCCSVLLPLGVQFYKHVEQFELWAALGYIGAIVDPLASLSCGKD